MALSHREVSALVDAGIVDRATAERISSFLSEQGLGDTPWRIDATRLAYVVGAVVVFWAMGWFMNETYDRYGGYALAVTALAYSTVFLLGGESLWKKPELRLAGGLLHLMSVGMLPLLVLGVSIGAGVWPEMATVPREEFLMQIRLPRVAMELAAVAGALALVRLRPFALLAAGIVYALWGMAIDVTTYFAGPDAGFLPMWINLEVTFVYGLLVLAAAFLWDRRTRADYALWCYVGGMAFAWGALTANDVGSHVYGALCVAAVLAAILLERIVFAAFGVAGLLFYLGYLAFEVFEDSVLFPLALIVIGVAIIAGGTQYRTKREAIDGWLLSVIPTRIADALPRNR